MTLLYNVGIHLYHLIAWLIAPFKTKARLFVTGRKGQFESIAKIENRTSNWVWFHVASLGEFEQSRPVMEMTKSEFPDIRILLTFFSPSGFEVRKDYPLADHVCYLPMDTPSNARKLIRNFNIKLACFVKNEYWLNYLKVLKSRKIPTINISAVFRQNQLFFKPWGGFYRGFLRYFDHILVQSKGSENLLRQINYHSVSTTGDTRFDRVWVNAKNAVPIDTIRQFKKENKLIVFGSVWPKDHKIIIPVLEKLISLGLRIIIAPHEVDPSAIRSLQNRLPGKAALFSKFSDDQPESNILLVDTIGHLASIYQYADLAYVGGAFRGTLHNILEPTAYGIPILFGKDRRNKKFPEAGDLVNLGVAQEVSSHKTLEKEIQLLINDNNARDEMGQSAKTYIETNKGASGKTMDIIRMYLNGKR